MKFTVKPTDPSRLETDVLIILSSQAEKIASSNSELNLLLKEAISREHFEDKEGNFLFLTTKGLIAPYKLLIAGQTKNEELDYFKLQEIIAKSIKKAKEIKPAKISVLIPDEWLRKFSVEKAVAGVVEAVSLSSYQFLKFKSEEEQKKNRPLEEVILSLPAGKLEAADSGVKLGTIFSEAALHARDLVNEPAEITTPSYLAKVAEDLAKTSQNQIKVKILSRDEVKKLGMGAFLGVARGSDEEPKFIHLQYQPKRPRKKIVLIGKGITFDTGGLSLKGAEHMETMKLDMAGAAAVISVFSVLPKISPNIEVVGLIAACENMPSGKALKPGDILTAMNGKTIEVLNTDAEGRLTLADALSYAVLKEKPDEIIDLATLTGACMVALGGDIAGLWGNDEKFLDRIENSASQSGERLWRMPLFGDYRDLIKSNIADLKNIQTGRYGGAVTAALFLSEFVNDVSWVHLDIAGPAYVEKDSALIPKGGSGYGVRLLLNYLLTSL